MICPTCHFDVPPQNKFCVECGLALTHLCSACRSEMYITYKFCGQCGHQAEAPVAAPVITRPPQTVDASDATASAASAPTNPGEAEDQETASSTVAAQAEDRSERKQVTVLACEIVTGDTDDEPDVLHGLLNQFFEMAQTEIDRYEGTVSRFLARGFVALFGAPVAHEDHAHRAVLAAWGLHRQIVARSPQLGVDCEIRIGIDTGMVVLGGRSGSALGEPMQITSRLLHHAKPGSILLSDSAARMVENRISVEKTQPVPPHQEEPGIEAWRVTEAGQGLTASAHFRSSNLTPFIGRSSELGNLEKLREQASQGRGQIVGLVGDAGMGKSRILHEFFRRTFPGSQTSYLRGQCQSYAVGIPYLPLIDMIRKASQITESDSPATISEKLYKSMEQIGTDAESVPYFLRLLGVEEGTEVLDELEPQALQARTFAAMRRMLLDAARERLVVVEIEDIHWIDQTSQEFINSLIEASSAAKILLILSYRSGEPPRWMEKSYATQISINRLSSEESRELVAALLRRGEVSDERIHSELAGDIIDKAEGNPLFLEELARALMERSDDQETVIPSTIQGILTARIDRLPEEHKQLLRTASVIGREVSHDLLQEIWTAPQDPLALLEDLRGWELLYLLPSEDHQISSFTHALTCDVAYESLLTTQRQEIHQRIASAIESLYEGHLEDAYDRLIHHFPRAGNAEKTVHYLELFAARAARSYAHNEAARALRETLVHTINLPEEQRDRKSIEMLLRLVESLLPLAGFPETRELLEEYREALDRLDDQSLRAPYFFWLAHTYTYLGDQDLTREYAQTSIAAAKEVEDEVNEGKAWYVLGRDGFWSGRFPDGIDASLRAVVLLERNGEPWWQGQADWVAGFNHYALGQFEEGIEALERARRIGEALDDYRLDTSWSLGYFYASLGAAEEGVAQCRRGLEEAQDPLNKAVAQGFLGHAHLQGGDIEGAIKELSESVAGLKAAGMLQLHGWFDAFLAEALLMAGKPEDALAHAREALEATRAAQFPYGIGLAQHALGAIENDLDALRSALEYFEEIKVPFEAARTRLNLARLLHENGADTDAARELEAARETFTELGLPSFEEKTEKLAEEFQQAN